MGEGRVIRQPRDQAQVFRPRSPGLVGAQVSVQVLGAVCV